MARTGHVPPVPVIRILLLAAIAAMMAGCLDCEPLLEVRNCLDHQCEPSPDAVSVVWSQSHAEAWPAIDAALQATALGEHSHAPWSQADEVALWDAFGVSGNQPELFVNFDDQRFRVRVLTCD